MARISKEQKQFKQPTKDIIFCEDTKSSAIYIDLMKQKFRKSIEIKACNGGSPLEDIRLAINIIKNERSPEYNNKFCIFDLDIIKSQQNELEECKKLAKANNIKLILCDPDFEYYTLLHFKEYTGNDKNTIKKEVLEYCNKQNLRGVKNSDKLYKKLVEDECEKLTNNKELNDTAFERNKKIYKLGHNKTNFYELIEFIKKR